LAVSIEKPARKAHDARFQGVGFLMRLLVLVLALAACAASPEGTSVQMSSGQRVAAAAALGQMSNYYNQRALMQRQYQLNAATTTTCTPGYGGSFSCNSF
jgi:ABC-type molybdate transport system substrate-binding protein